jgi:hypothetical protein
MLGWKPEHPGLAADLDSGHDFDARPPGPLRDDVNV